MWARTAVPLGGLVGSVGWGSHMQLQGAWSLQIAMLRQHPLFVGKKGYDLQLFHSQVADVEFVR